MNTSPQTTLLFKQKINQTIPPLQPTPSIQQTLFTKKTDQKVLNYKFDIIIIGAGITGATLAQKYANTGKKVLIIEKRNHIAGNCFDYYENEILINKYGAHLFHTNDEEVWTFINKFGKWVNYKHTVKAQVGNKLVPVPVNIETFNKLLDINLNIETINEWVKNNIPIIETPKNSKESCVSKVGNIIYDTIFKPYTKKQWDKYPEELDPSVLDRIPVRYSFEDGYFADKYQAIPLDGYTKIVKNMLDHTNITIMLNTDYFTIKNLLIYDKLFYTGPIDLFYSKLNLPKLEYRSLKFEIETLPINLYQSQFVINYPDPDKPYTRIIEYKHIQHHPTPPNKTVIVKEYSCNEGEPYYPVISERNKLLYKQYQEFAIKENNIFFVGRLASYKYYNMDQAIKSALDMFREQEENKSQ
jgi:UDP-galactopyranose mutase